MPNRRFRGRGGRRRGRTQRFPLPQPIPSSARTYVRAFSLSSPSEVGTEPISWGDLTSSAANLFLWKMNSVDVEVVSAPGLTTTTRVQIELGLPQGGSSQLSRIFAVGGTTLRFKVRNSRITDWASGDNTDPAVTVRYQGVISIVLLIHFSQRSDAELA